MLALKRYLTTRLVKTLFRTYQEAEDRGANADELRTILGTNAAKRGM